jgi:hypothetical protein
MLIKKNYDPVQELNKSLELFELHHKPSPQDLFDIII